MVPLDSGRFAYQSVGELICTAQSAKFCTVPVYRAKFIAETSPPHADDEKLPTLPSFPRHLRQEGDEEKTMAKKLSFARFSSSAM
ncbi:hypothetical protein GW17_00001154 [Ensete ventricosum]|nr:hypothetical protein GW17_00001154 [Ensete ventricosum]